MLAGCPRGHGARGQRQAPPLLRVSLGKNTAYNEIAFANAIAPKFNPARARACSASFKYFWDLLESKFRN